jgi:hypothetical protein
MLTVGGWDEEQNQLNEPNGVSVEGCIKKPKRRRMEDSPAVQKRVEYTSGKTGW